MSITKATPLQSAGLLQLAIVSALLAFASSRVDAADDLVVSPTYLPDLVNASLDLLIDGERGIWHLVNEGAATWAQLARDVARLAGLDESLVRARPSTELGFLAPRPRNSALASERGWLMPPLDRALARCVGALTADSRATRDATASASSA